VQSSSSSKPSSSSLAFSSSSISNTFKDSRDNKVYKKVIIGTQTWMAENLNYDATNSKCYSNSEANCTQYGRLYNWATAMGFGTTCTSNTCASQVQSKHKGICPQGWHIPSDADWNTLRKYVNPSCSDSPVGCADAGTKLKTTSGWNTLSSYPLVVGTDNYGFSALPGGLLDPWGNYKVVGSNGYWWSTSEYDRDNAYYLYMQGESDKAFFTASDKRHSLSIRCLQDE